MAQLPVCHAEMRICRMEMTLGVRAFGMRALTTQQASRMEAWWRSLERQRRRAEPVLKLVEE